MVSSKSTELSTRMEPHQSAPLLWRARRSYPLLAASLVVALISFFSQVSACSVPVFRYALERWIPDNYHVMVFHEKSLTETQSALLDPLRDVPSTDQLHVNLDLTMVDVTNHDDENMLSLRNHLSHDNLPSVAVSYPNGHFSKIPFWSGALNAENIRRISDSPARREIARRLLKGESAVWVLLESGQLAKDQQAYDHLNERLDYLNDKLELPPINPADIQEGLLSIDEDELKIAFSTLRISRKDPEESFFVKMLLGTEDDLMTFDEPMAFPIYGRGRALYALIGEGIRPDVIDESCVFLTGACSCEVKDQNPGVDLVMNVDWDHLVPRQFEIDRALPPLTGLVALETSPTTGNDTEPNTADPNQEVVKTVAAPTSNRNILMTTLIACAAIGGFALLATFFMVRRK